MYKDKDKQREANAERQRRYKAKHKGVTIEGVTDKALPERTGINLDAIGLAEAPNSFGGTKLIVKPKQAKPYQMTVMERLFYRPASELGRGETNFVSLPGRVCYNMFKRKARG